MFSIIDCARCPDLVDGFNISLCDTEAGIAGASSRDLEVVQTDGVLLLRMHQYVATGPLDSDGRFAAGAVFDVSSGLTEGHAVLRIDGTIETSGGHRLSGRLRHRLIGAVTSDGEITTIDCVETLEVLAVSGI